MAIEPGRVLQVRTASDEVVRMVATTRAMKGRDFAVVWVCSPEEYERATRAGDEPDVIAWPLDAVVAEAAEV